MHKVILHDLSLLSPTPVIFEFSPTGACIGILKSTVMIVGGTECLQDSTNRRKQEKMKSKKYFISKRIDAGNVYEKKRL